MRRLENNILSKNNEEWQTAEVEEIPAVSRLVRLEKVTKAVKKREFIGVIKAFV